MPEVAKRPADKMKAYIEEHKNFAIVEEILMCRICEKELKALNNVSSIFVNK